MGKTLTILSDIVVVVLLFYVHGKHLRSCREGQLTTLFLGRLRPPKRLTGHMVFNVKKCKSLHIG